MKTFLLLIILAMSGSLLAQQLNPDAEMRLEMLEQNRDSQLGNQANTQAGRNSPSPDCSSKDRIINWQKATIHWLEVENARLKEQHADDKIVINSLQQTIQQYTGSEYHTDLSGQ